MRSPSAFRQVTRYSCTSLRQSASATHEPRWRRSSAPASRAVSRMYSLMSSPLPSVESWGQGRKGKPKVAMSESERMPG